MLGVNIFIFLFNVFGSNLRHSHIGIRYWKWLEFILISPAQHHLHHSVSKEHHNKNFGVSLAIWDWIFGSLHHSEETDSLILGIGNSNNDNMHNLRNLYTQPILEIWILIKKRLNRFKQIKKIKEIY